MMLKIITLSLKPTLCFLELVQMTLVVDMSASARLLRCVRDR